MEYYVAQRIVLAVLAIAGPAGICLIWWWPDSSSKAVEGDSLVRRDQTRDKSKNENSHRNSFDSNSQEKQQEEFKQHRSKSQKTIPKEEIYYGKILKLNGAITFSDVKRSYRTLAAQYHPDKVNHLGDKLQKVAEQEFKEINEAFDYFQRKYKK